MPSSVLILTLEQKAFVVNLFQMAQLDDLVVRKGDVAVVFYDGIGETKMTYDELHQTADTIAVALGRSSNCDGQAVIGIFMEMSVLVPACILG